MTTKRTNEGSTGGLTTEKVLHVIPDLSFPNIHELAVYTKAHTLNAIGKYAEFAEAASKAYPAILAMDKQFNVVRNGHQPIDLGEGFGIMGWHEFLKSIGIKPGNYATWKSRYNASLAKAQRDKIAAAEEAAKLMAGAEKAKVKKVLEAERETAELALTEAKAELDELDEAAPGDAYIHAKAKAIAAEQVTEAIKGKILEFTPKPRPTGTTPTPAALDTETIHKVAEDDEFVLMAAELAELILGMEVVPTAEMFSHMVNLATGIKTVLSVKGKAADQTLTSADPNAVNVTGTAAQSSEPLKHGEREDADQFTEKVGNGHRKKPQSAMTVDNVEKVG